MANLTVRRLEQAKEILDRHNASFLESHYLDERGLEMELRELWGLGYQELKGIMIDLSKEQEYSLLATRYMETGFPSVISEFKATLANVYGLPTFHVADLEAKKKEFCERQFGK